MQDFTNWAALYAWLELKKQLPDIRVQRQQLGKLCRLYEALEFDLEQDNIRNVLFDIKALGQAFKKLKTE